MLARLFRTCLAAAIAGGLGIFSQAPAPLAAEDARWSQVPLPANGVSAGWVLAAGADTRYLTAAVDGTLYCYATPTGTPDRLFKSTDGGLSWSSVGRVRDTIIAIAAAPFDASTIYYATVSSVYRSTDAGATFVALPPNPGGAGSGNVQITSLDVARPGAGNLVAVATRDTDAGKYGGVYLLDESSPAGIWLDSSIGNYDVLRVAYSPVYMDDRTLFAVATNETDMVVRTKVVSGGWGQIIADARLPGVTPVAASVAFPPDYHMQGNFYVAFNTGTNRGDVCGVTSQPIPGPSSIVRLGIGTAEGLTGIDISSLIFASETGGATLVAGCARQSRTYTSLDGGAHWTPCQKAPSGQTDLSLAAGGTTDQQTIYAVTCGTEAPSRSPLIAARVGIRHR